VPCQHLHVGRTARASLLGLQAAGFEQQQPAVVQQPVQQPRTIAAKSGSDCHAIGTWSLPVLTCRAVVRYPCP